jgi:hypothetical protein
MYYVCFIGEAAPQLWGAAFDYYIRGLFLSVSILKSLFKFCPFCFN